MILYNQVPIDIESIKKDYPLNSIENKIIDILRKSEEKYNYDDEKHLKFELLFRSEIIHASKELDQSHFKFRIFRESICNTKYWNRMNDGGFELKSEVKPSEAIRDIFNNGSKYGSECATAMVIVYLKALLNIFSDQRYDELFTNIILMNWYRIHPLLIEVGRIQDAIDFLPGDRRYFDNPDVNPLTPEWQGENVIDMGDDTYYGHGMGINQANAFIDSLNRMRKNNATRSAYLMNVVGRPNFNNIATYYYHE